MCCSKQNQESLTFFLHSSNTCNFSLEVCLVLIFWLIFGNLLVVYWLFFGLISSSLLQVAGTTKGLFGLKNEEIGGWRAENRLRHSGCFGWKDKFKERRILGSRYVFCSLLLPPSGGITWCLYFFATRTKTASVWSHMMLFQLFFFFFFNKKTVWNDVILDLASLKWNCFG